MTKQELTMSAPFELLKLSAAKRDAAARAIESELHEIVYEQKFVTVGDCVNVASIALKAADEVQRETKVKALDWYKDSAGDFAAETPFGKYTAWRFSWGWDVEFNNRSVDDAKGLPSAGKAKAAAQADYERRVMSALDGAQ